MPEHFPREITQVTIVVEETDSGSGRAMVTTYINGKLSSGYPHRSIDEARTLAKCLAEYDPPPPRPRTPGDRMILAAEDERGFFVEVTQVVAVSPAIGMGLDAIGYHVLLRDGRSLQVSLEHGAALLKWLA